MVATHPPRSSAEHAVLSRYEDLLGRVIGELLADPDMTDRERESVRFASEAYAEGRIHFGLTHARREIGRCVQTREAHFYLLVSRVFVAKLSEARLEEVMRHEIAHLLDLHHRCRSGHDEAWQHWARLCKTPPVEYSELSDDESPLFKHSAVCSEHGVIGGFARRPTRTYRCRQCGRVVEVRQNY